MARKSDFPLLSVVCFLSLVLTLACGSIPETHYYTIGRIVPEPGQFTRKIDLSVGVPQFEADGIYARDNLLYRLGNYEIASDYYRRWGCPPQKMLAESTVKYLHSSGIFAQVLRMPTMSRVDLVLEGRILRFEELSNAEGSTVRVDLEFSLRKEGNRSQIWWQEVSASSPVGPVRSPETIVQAVENSVRSCLDQATDSIVKALSNLSAK
ncbi:MAG TPA: ABC-type transport auxiliary lipoprotein family protein [archaeon]|nr:ABC-type transport auxiliary lipoprotein family protein [archaeon]